MKLIQILYVLIALSCLFCPVLHAQDDPNTPPALTATSTADDILAAVDQVARAQMEEKPDAPFGYISPKTSQFAKTLKACDHKALIDAAMRVPSNVGGDNQKRYLIESGVIQHAVWNSLASADLPYLLSLPSLTGYWMDCIAERKLSNDPAVTDFLLATLKQAKDTSPNVRVPNSIWSNIQKVINQNKDSRVVRVLTALINKDTSDINVDQTEGTFIFALADLCAFPKSPHSNLFTPCLVSVIQLHDTKGIYAITNLINQAVKHHPELLSDPKFVSTSLDYLKNSTESAAFKPSAELMAALQNPPPPQAAPMPVPPPAPAAPAPETAPASTPAAATTALAVAPTPSNVVAQAGSKTHVACTITAVAPLEAYGPDGAMLSVTSAVIGKSYECVQVDNGKAVLQDATGNTFKIRSDAVSQTPQ